MLNPYPYEIQAYSCVAFIFDSKNGENEVYRTFERSHFRGVWGGRNVDILEGYDIDAIKKIFEKNLDDLGLGKPNYHLNYGNYLQSLEKNHNLR